MDFVPLPVLTKTETVVSITVCILLNKLSLTILNGKNKICIYTNENSIVNMTLAPLV